MSLKPPLATLDRLCRLGHVELVPPGGAPRRPRAAADVAEFLALEPAGRVVVDFVAWVQVHLGTDRAVRDAVRGFRAARRVPVPAGGGPP